VAFGEPPLREHHVRQRVVRPRLLAPHRDGRRALASASSQEVALLPAEGQHAVQVGHVGRRRAGRPAPAQHAGRVAAVEQVVLAQLERHQVARMFARLFLVQRDGARDVAVGPGGDGRDEALLARRGALRARLCAFARKGRALATASRDSANRCSVAQ
jgi:hypothetical protein